MGKTIRLTKGFDINLDGSAVKLMGDTPAVSTYAIKPADFHGFKPKVLAKEGTEVKAGTPIVYDKNNDQVMFCAPVSGEVVEVNRGAKRKLLEIKILADKELTYEELGTQTDDLESLDRDTIVEGLLKSGAWPMFRRRPFAKVARPEDRPKAIMITGFDSAPFGADLNFIMEGKDEAFQQGITILRKLTDGKVHLNLKGGAKEASAFANAEGVEKNHFYGPHPSGTVGVQIHHLDPMRKGESVWYINPQDVITIGRVFTEGKYMPERVVALNGTPFKERKYYKTYLGAAVEAFTKNNLRQDNVRFVSGSPLFGEKVEGSGFISFYDDELCAIEEGDEPEFQGWLLPSYPRPSVSKAFPWAFSPDKKFVANTNTHGEERAFIMTGQYEKVLPMDIYPVYLLKEIMSQNIERMEGLGIYEVAEEDMALCEFACTSKIPVTEIIRQGLDLIEKEG